MTALIFDCDGVLADTERHGHLPAFNQVFEEFGLPVRWSEDDYGAALGIGGGKERMASLLTPDLVVAAGLPHDRVGQLATVAEWHRRKTEIYIEIVEAGRLPARPGIKRIVDAARRAGWQLAVCSTSAEASVRAILDHAVGAAAAGDFLVLAGDVVPRKKPAPDIYRLACERLDISPAEAVVIEDSRNGLLAAVAAGLATVVTVNDYTAQQGFDEARLVVTSLGDSGGPGTKVVENRSKATPGDYVTLRDLAALLD
ncbi:MAG: haloacid dehalogenase [Planctomycetota bacterium]|nr:MAG: haloacid dehalogenase [Planctomycetota bacterium]